MRKIGLIDVDGHNFPNLPLMKISAWHKAQGDSVEWYQPIGSGHMDKVYLSKVFSFTPDFQFYIDADEISKGGSGYCISLVDGREVFDKSKDTPLPDEIEHICPDYSLYGITDTAYGFLTRGCPRGCEFCHVAPKEGKASRKVADLEEFWRGQRNIVLNDPNILACPDWHDLLLQLIDSGAWVEFNQGLDIRLMTAEKAELIKRLKVNSLHFAWDRYEDGDVILPKLELFSKVIPPNKNKHIVYVLCNNGEQLWQSLERIYTLRDMGFSPFVMIYNKDSLPNRHILRKLMRWCNNKWVFSQVERFEDYRGIEDEQINHFK